MGWYFINNITTLSPDYHVRVEIIADCGTTGTLNVNNGGYIADLRPVDVEMDNGSGQYKPGSVTLKLRNVDSVFSTNVFNGNITEVELRIWITFDGGTTFECDFCGFVEWQNRKWEDFSTTDDTLRIYEITAHASFLRLKDIEVDQAAYPITASITQNDLALYKTDATGAPVFLRKITGNFFRMYLMLENFLARIPFISGVTDTLGHNLEPIVDVDYSGLELMARNLNVPVNYDFSYFCMVDGFYVDPAKAGPLGGAYGYTNSNLKNWYTLSETKNYLEALRRVLDQFLVIPIPRLIKSGVDYYYKLYLEPFITDASSLTAVAGSLPNPLFIRGGIEQYYNGVTAVTKNLPEEDQGTTIYSGKPREFRLWNTTSPNIGGGLTQDPYLFQQSHIIPTTGEGLVSNTISAQQLFLAVSAISVRNAHKFKHVTSQSYQETSGAGYYGIQKSVADLCITDANKSLLSSPYRDGFGVGYHTLRGNDLWDFRINRKLTIQGKTCKILKTSRDYLSGNTTIYAPEVV